MTNNPPTPSAPTPRKKRRAVFWSIIAIVLIVVAAFAYYPECAITPFRVMPDECVIVTENLRLAEKWRERISNPAVLATMRLCDVDDPEEIASDAQLELILDLLCGKRTVLGMVPELGDAGLPAFVGASYVGPRLLPLRFLVLIRYVPGIGPIHRTEQGTMYLDFEEDKESDHEVLSLDLREGVLLAAWSLDKDAVHALTLRLESDAEPPSIFESDTPWTNPLRAPMRAWFDKDFPEFQEELKHASNPRLTVSKWDRNDFAAKICSACPDDELNPPTLAKSCAALDMLPDASPIAIAVIPGELASKFFSSGANANGNAMRETMQSGDACAILTRQDIGAKIMGLAIPALQVTLPWKSSRTFSPDSLILDLLNHSFGADAIKRGTNDSRTLLDLPNLSIIRTPDSDCMAIDAYQDWITITTSAAAADNLRASPIDGTAQWRKGWREIYDREEPVMYFWADLNAIAEEARRLLAVYRLAATFVPELNNPETSTKIATTAIALDELAAAQQLECSAEYQKDATGKKEKVLEISLRLGGK